MFISCKGVPKATSARAEPNAIIHMGIYQRAKSARMSLGTVPFNCSLITELSGKDISDKIMLAESQPKPLTALSAKLRELKKYQFPLSFQF